MRDYLTDEEQRVFYDYEKMFQTEGWRRLMNEVQAELDALPEQCFLAAKNYEEVRAYRVRATVLAELIAYEDIINQRKQVLETEREQAAEEARIAEANEKL